MFSACTQRAVQMESVRSQLREEHDRSMEKLRRDMADLQAQEAEREQQELESARKRQAAIDDLDRGVRVFHV